MTFIDDGVRKACFVSALGLLTACSGQSPEDLDSASTDESKKEVDIGKTKQVDVGELTPVNAAGWKAADAARRKPVDAAAWKQADAAERKPGDVGQTRPGDVGQTRPGDVGQTRPGDVGQTTQALGSVFFEGSCTNGQKRDLETFHGWLSGYVSDAFWNWSSYPGRRQQAFGNLSSSDTTHVYQTLDNMDYWMENDSFTYSCETDGPCTTAAAWVYSNHINNTFHICPGWWAQDNQWRLFILTHELSHLAGADDWYYPGYDDWTSTFIFQAYLPDIAARNANNYGLYVMNPFGYPN